MKIQKLDEGVNLSPTKTIFIDTFNLPGDYHDYVAHHINGVKGYTSSKYSKDNVLSNIALIPKQSIELNVSGYSAKEIHELIHLLRKYYNVLGTAFIPIGRKNEDGEPQFKSILSLVRALKTSKLNPDGEDD